ncbi:MAG: type I polyketide synthase, partial [Acidimicrobiales bacterium]
MDAESQYSDFDIAIIGMAGRFPKARNLDDYWRNLVDGTDCVTWFTREELAESGVDPELLDDPNYVPAAPVLEDADRFDAEFFGYSPKEAKSIDPQQRQLLECGWLAFENSGYDPGRFDGRIGVFAGTAMNTYFINTGLNRQFNLDYLPTLLGNDKDFLATRLSYKLGLQGPALTVQTACSTSLVAIHYASQSLLSGESDMALVTAAAVRVPLATGHLYEDASVFAKDGKCRAFDADATGTIFGSGVGAVVLKSANNAVRDGDNIRAIIRGSAVNNDGNEKSDFTAPSVSMQAAAITEAMAAADVTADSIDYVEAHGTGTYLGDPIEVAALTEAYRADTDETGYCKIGSVKSNVGHLDAAAGMASLIKVVLSLENELLPKTMHFSKPNPQIDFDSAPFEPAAENSPWTRAERPRRAGITSLGMGGTNAHIIVEEAQEVPSDERKPARPAEDTVPLVLTARTKADLDRLSTAIGEHLADHPALPIADVATTLASRAPFPEKRFVYGADRPGLIETLTTKASPLTAEINGAPTPGDGDGGPIGDTVFLFTGQGAQRVGMGQGLYQSSAIFKDAVDRCAELFREHIDVDIRAEMWLPTDDSGNTASEDEIKAAQARLAETWLTQPTLFTIEYALAQWWLSEGVIPAAMLGHSIGELTAAAVAEVMSLEDAVRLVSVRATAMFEAEPGSMVAIEADEDTIRPLLGGPSGDGIELAVQNGAESLVLAGTHESVAELTAELDRRDLAYRELRTSHAFHTATMDSAAAKVAETAAGITMSRPKIPVVSNIHGGWYGDADRTDPDYWAKQVRSTVRFADGLATLLESGPRAFIELGPAATLTGLVTAHGRRTGHHQVRSTLPPRTGQVDDLVHASSTRAWLAVVGGAPASTLAPNADLGGSDATGTPRTVELPGYPFAGKSYWYTAPDQTRQTRSAGISGHD